MKRMIKVLSGISVSFHLSGCLLSNPFHNQVINTTDSEFLVRAWDLVNDVSTNFQDTSLLGYCKNDGILQGYGYALWVDFDSDDISVASWVDAAGRSPLQMDASITLPDICWENVGGQYQTQFRVENSGCHLGEPCIRYYNVDRLGLGCVVGSYLRTNSWLSWLSERCHRTDPVTGSAERWITLIANSS